MPWMPDKMPFLQNGAPTETVKILLDNAVDIKAAEKRILSSTEHLNEILALIDILTVHSRAESMLMVGYECRNN